MKISRKKPKHELRCIEKGGAEKWKLELNVRMKE